MNDLYEHDTVAWAAQQAALLRRVAAGERPNTAPDWTNIAEEIGSLGKAQARELANRIAIILEHLFKLAASPAAAPRIGWLATLRRERREIEILLGDAPSLRARVAVIIVAKTARARADAASSLADHNEAPVLDLHTLSFTESRVLANWFP